MEAEKIFVVIVFYNSSLIESSSFQSLQQAASQKNLELDVLIYNNSPDYWQYGNEQFAELNLAVVNDPNNSGVSKAYNLAYQLAVDKGKNYLLLLDQDTILSTTFFDSFIKAQANNSNTQLFCPLIKNGDKLLSPAKFFMYTTQILTYIKPGIHEVKGLAIINSCLIVSSKLFCLVGGYNEKIKLDFSDFDFLKRSLSFTKTVYVLDTVCMHELSGESDIPFTSALNRFKYYVEGARNFKKSYLAEIGMFFWVLLRSVKLNLRYKTLSFTTKAIGYFYN